MPADLLNAATTFVDGLATLDVAAVLAVTFLSTAVEMTFLLGLLIPGESVVMLAGSRPPVRPASPWWSRWPRPAR